MIEVNRIDSSDSNVSKLATVGAKDSPENKRELKRLENLERKRRLKFRRVLYPLKPEQAGRPARRKRDANGNKVDGYV